MFCRVIGEWRVCEDEEAVNTTSTMINERWWGEGGYMAREGHPGQVEGQV